MADKNQEADPDEGDGEGENPDQNPEENSGDAGDIAELAKQLAAMKDLVKKQQEVIEKFTDAGKESPPEKTDKERIQELETTLGLFKKKIEADQQAKEQAERQKRETVVDSLIKEIPEFKDQRDALMKVDESVLSLFAKRQTNSTPNPVSRLGAPLGSKPDWNKKLALATERRKKHQETLQTVKY